jgi:2-dehydro-3-deoxyphosphogluconate aldolase/(4S)-4-hydroxy-2-oxoglutarate aldolase
MSKRIIDTILEKRIVAIIRGVNPYEMKDTVKALLDGGVNCVEVTFNQKSEKTLNETLESINIIKKEFNESICLGAGTVISTNQVEMAVDAGAEYIISPNTDVDVIKKTKELGKISIPGALTPSEAVTGFNAGADIVKLFPAGLFGTEYIKALLAPLSHIPVVAVGGVNLDNICDFFNVGVKGVGIGGNLVDLKAIREGDFEKLTTVSKAYMEKVNK